MSSFTIATPKTPRQLSSFEWLVKWAFIIGACYLALDWTYGHLFASFPASEEVEAPFYMLTSMKHGMIGFFRENPCFVAFFMISGIAFIKGMCDYINAEESED